MMDSATRYLILGGLFAIAALMFMAFNEASVRDDFDVRCKDAGGVTMIQSRRFVCVKTTYLPIT